MRQPNVCQPLQNKASVEISATLYDRRALDSTSALPLVNSLTHLNYLTSISSKTREILATDGALERLIQILKNEDYFDLYQPCCKAIVANIIWQLSFQCVVNIGIRGPESIREKVVLSDIASVVVTILDDFISTMDNFTLYSSKDVETAAREPLNPVTTTTSNENSSSESLSLPNQTQVIIAQHESSESMSVIDSLDFSGQRSSNLAQVEEHPSVTSFTSPGTSTFDGNRITPSSLGPSQFSAMTERRASETSQSWGRQEDDLDPSFSHFGSMQRKHRYHQEEDVLYCLQLLAYLTKYTYLRHLFQNAHDAPNLRVKNATNPGAHKAKTNTYKEFDNYEFVDSETANKSTFNVFSLVERFTMRIHSPEIQYWAGVVMRNVCRKDERRGGIRQCANLECGKWEEYNRQFAKCRRCRRTKYCGKACQSKAWPGHRWWCRLRQAD